VLESTEMIVNMCNKDNNAVFVVLLSIQQFIFHQVINYLLCLPTGQDFSSNFLQMLDHWAVETHRTTRSQQMGTSCMRYNELFEQVFSLFSWSWITAWPKWVSWRFVGYNSCLILLEHRWWCVEVLCVFSDSIQKLVDPTYNALELSACNGNFLHVMQNMIPSSLLYSILENKLRQRGMNLRFLSVLS